MPNIPIAAAAVARLLGTRRIRAGARSQVGSTSLPAPQALTVYTAVRTYTPNGDSHQYDTTTSTNYRVRLFAQIGVGAGTKTVEIPAGKHFGIVAQAITVFAEIWPRYPESVSDPVPVIVPATTAVEAEIDLTIAEGVGDASLPTVWVVPDLNRWTGTANVGTPLGSVGTISQQPCVLASLVGFNAGASSRYLMVFGDSTQRPDLVLPVAAGAPFAIDLANSGGRPFPNGCTWGASSTPAYLTLDSAATFRVDAEVLYL